MTATATPPQAAPKIWGEMPARMKVLFITTLHRTGGWLAEAFANDSASEIFLEEAIGVTAGLSRLRDEIFDAVLISHEPGVLDAIDVIDGLRAGGSLEPMIVLGNDPSAEVSAVAYEVGADAYCCVTESTTRSLLWTFARAIERSNLMRENHRLIQNDRQRLAQEHREAERLLEEQRLLIADLNDCGVQIADGELDGKEQRTEGEEPNDESPKQTPCDLPEPLIGHYREILRAYVIMGAGNLADEMADLAELLAEGNVSASQAMQMHVHVLEELIRGLGNRSARHVMNRADLLILDVIVHLADGYRARYHEKLNPPKQQLLPGFDPPASPSLSVWAA